MPVAAHDSSPALRDLRTQVGTEFGETLLQLLVDVPDGRCAILVDEQGNAIDLAHAPADVDPLDVELYGAQFVQAIGHLAQTCGRFNLPLRTLILEATHGQMLAAALGPYAVMLVLHPHGNIGRALHAFEPACARMGEFL